MTAPHADQIIDGYLARLEAALAPLPPARRQELLEDVRTHIAEARSALANETDADVLTIIDRLGDPAETAAAELGREPEGVARTAVPAGIVAANVQEILAIIFLVVFWPVGVVLLWVSSVFTTRDKIIGTLVPPGGYLATFFVIPTLLLGIGPVCTSWSGTDSLGHTTFGSTCPQGLWGVLLALLGIVALALFTIGPIVTAVYLAVRLRRARDRAAASSAAPASRLVG